jgi:hypothetical protein
MKKHTAKSAAKQKTDLTGWFSPVTQAKYWAGLIGRIKRVSGKGRSAICHLVFEYKRDGTKLAQPEEFTFPVTRLKPVTDFAARVKKHRAPKPANPYDDDFDLFNVEVTS